MRIPLATGLMLAATVSAASAVPLEGTWTGVYNCAQGATPAELYIQRAPTGRLDARFHFGDGSPGRPVGCFAMLGAPDPNDLQFTATHWFCAAARLRLGQPRGDRARPGLRGQRAWAGLRRFPIRLASASAAAR